MKRAVNLPGRLTHHLQVGLGQIGCAGVALQGLQPQARSLAKTLEINPQGLIVTALQPAQAFTGENHGAMVVTPLKVELGDGNLQKTLQNRPHRTLAFVPELLKTIVAGVPIAGIEQADRLMQPWIRQKLGLLIGWPSRVIVQEFRPVAGGTQRLAVFFIGNLRSRIDSGVTSSISSGPMYSSALSRVI